MLLLLLLLLLLLHFSLYCCSLLSEDKKAVFGPMISYETKKSGTKCLSVYDYLRRILDIARINRM